MTAETTLPKPVAPWWRVHGLALLGTGLMAVVVLAYYGRGGLLAPELLAVWSRVGADLLGALVVALPCAGLGQQFLIWAGVRLPSGGERALVAFVLGVGALALVTLGLVGLGFAQRQPLGYLAGAQTASAYQGHWQGWYQAAIEAVVALPAGTQTEFLWEPRVLACPDRCRGDVIADRWYHLRRTVGGADQILAYWRASGVTHVLMYTGAAEYERTAPTSLLSAEDWEVLTQVRARLQPVQVFGGAYHLYALPGWPPPGGGRPGLPPTPRRGAPCVRRSPSFFFQEFCLPGPVQRGILTSPG